MGRSSGSCFKIIACGKDSDDNHDTYQVLNPQVKGSNDKRGWSFRKRPASQRVLRSTIEMPSSLNSKSPETVPGNLQTQPKETFTEKTSSISWTEEIPQLVAVIPKISDSGVASEDGKLDYPNPDESIIVVMQTAIRRFLAQRQMLKVKHVVKLQAVVRGHLVRNHAVGTLRCVQAIVKVQGLVRARQARIASEAKPLGRVTSRAKQHVAYISIEKLLSNRFAHQLLESTPKTKPINIKCDPSSRSDSAWNWLERWMSVSSKGDDLRYPSEGCKSTDLKTGYLQTVVVDQSSLAYDSINSSKTDDLNPAQPLISDTLVMKQLSSGLNSVDIKEPHHSGTDTTASYKKPVLKIEQLGKSVKSSATEEAESERKKFSFETRKTTNAAFIAVQSKFEELSTPHSSERSTSSNKSKSEAISSSLETGTTKGDVGIEVKSVSQTSVVKVGGSECGTELSVTSTLDSPDRSSIGANDVDLEIEHKKDGSGNSNSCGEANFRDEPESDISNSVSINPEKLDTIKIANKEELSISEKPKLETEESNANINLSMEADQLVSARSSTGGASPISQMAASEFQETPSSWISVKAKKTKTDKSSSNKKTRSSSAGKLSASNSNHNFSVNNSLDGFPRDLKAGKRRSSFGSGRSDYAEQEPRDSSSSNSLPSYMQATESARAKALANGSPRSSPDVQGKDIHVKKSCSLTGANAKQVSPRLPNSKAEPNQGAKGNGHPQEKKWQR